MRLRLDVGSFVLLEVRICEDDAQGPSEPSDVHDLSTGHDIGFTAPVGWREPVDDTTEARR